MLINSIMKKKFSLIIVLFFVFSLVVFAQDDEDNDGGCKKLEKKTQRMYDKALDLQKKGKRNESRKLFLEIIEEEPDFPNPYYFLGLRVMREIDNVPAGQSSREVIEYETQRPIRLNSAIQYFSKTIEVCPEYNIQAYYFLGKLYFTKGMYEESAKFLKHYVSNRSLIRDEADYIDAKKLLKEADFYAEAYRNKVDFNPRIVSGVSSNLDEYLFCLAPDQETMYYSRRIPQDNSRRSVVSQQARDVERFYFSSFNTSKKRFSDGEEMQSPFNRSENEGGATITVDNKYMVFVRCFNMINGYYNCDLYFSEFIGGYWEDIKPIGISVNNPATWETMPSISADGKTLYLVSDRPGGFGGYDIYVSNKGDDGKWSTPVNMGPTINSSGNEKTPFIHSDSQTLYFSSDGHMGFGGYDIFYSKMGEDGKWENPKNIGFPINTERDETGFFVSIDGSKGYYASNVDLKTGEYRDWNLFEFDMPEFARPEKVVLIKGEVKSETGDIVEAVVSLKNAETKKVTEIPIDVHDGKYAMVAVLKNDYVLTVKKEGHAYETKFIEAKKPQMEAVQTMSFEVKPIEIGKTYNLDDINFATASFELTKESKLVIDAFVEFLNDNQTVKVELQGHTDNVGSAASNLTLSENRAKSVFDYIIQNGISASRLKSKGYGQTSPIADNNTEEGRAKNRRTVFVITER